MAWCFLSQGYGTPSLAPTTPRRTTPQRTRPSTSCFFPFLSFSNTHTHTHTPSVPGSPTPNLPNRDPARCSGIQAPYLPTSYSGTRRHGTMRCGTVRYDGPAREKVPLGFVPARRTRGRHLGSVMHSSHSLSATNPRNTFCAGRALGVLCACVRACERAHIYYMYVWVCGCGCVPSLVHAQ